MYLQLPGKIKTRGEIQGALMYPKKSYTLKLETKVSLVGLPASKNWILTANYTDKSFQRHRLCYELYQAMDPNNRAPKSAYVEVEANGAYQGAYILQQKVTAGQLGVNKSDSLAVVFKAPNIFVSSNPNLLPNNPFEQRFPDIEEEDRSAQAKALMQLIHESSDEKFADETHGIASLLDLQNIVDWHLLLILTNNTTGAFKNLYLYRVDSTTPFRIALWDADRGFGRDDDNELNLHGFVNINRNVLLKRLVELDAYDYRNQLRARWKTLVNEGVFAESQILERMRALEQEFEPLVQGNFEKWPVDGPVFFDDTTYHEELALMRDWLNKRYSRVEAYLDHFDRERVLQSH